MAIIEVNHVTKEYRLGQVHSLKQSVLDAVARLRGLPVTERAPFRALDDVDFKVEAGEVLGIIGENGAGKSTLLKLLARISTPTSGSVRVRGSVAALIEVGAGLVPDLTGRENIYLNGAILGIRRAEIKSRFDEIVAFAELEEFIDTPIKWYSSGMRVRIGFALATSVQADVLIVDEVLAVGDLAFQRKCFDRMEDMIKRQGKTVLMVSHNIRQVERLCARVMLLDHGKIAADGNPRSICDLFYERSDEKIRMLSDPSRKGAKGKKDNVTASGEVEILELALLDEKGQSTDRIVYESDVVFRLTLRVLQDLDRVIFGIGVHTTDFLYLTTHTSEQQVITQTLPSGRYQVTCRVRKFPLLPGVYSLRLGIAAGMAGRIVFYGENLRHFQVVQHEERHVPNVMREGFLAMDATWDAPRLDSQEREGVPVFVSSNDH